MPTHTNPANLYCMNGVRLNLFTIMCYDATFDLTEQNTDHISNTQIHKIKANINKKTNGRICHIPPSWESRWIFWLFNLSSPPKLIWFLIAFVCISNEGTSPLYLLTSDDAHTGSFFCFKYLQLFILANSCRQLLTGQHSQRNIMSGIRLHDHWLWEAVNNYAVETEKITACI